MGLRKSLQETAHDEREEKIWFFRSFLYLSLHLPFIQLVAGSITFVSAMELYIKGPQPFAVEEAKNYGPFCRVITAFGE